ncbi:MAG: peptide ABC transporter substrate-binding protein [Halobacteriovoraceae bacterium]|jgi:ABC-type transport system substrate-binding protein|nr:peptide ABC transporter substrate-binding protein [Halobacteriovoraceae bacterium]MBT5092663.1 peptide ABC transporter substrate-binding protein [Halobacteriovoraceae bacterium]
MKTLNLIALLTAFLLASPAFAKLGNPKAPKTGVFKYNLKQGPTTLNPLSSTDYYASIVQSYIIESLLERNVDTYGWEPGLATKWSTSKNGLEYTFTLRDGVTWHDGKPVTVEDVKFSYDAVVHPKNKYKTAHSKSYFENIVKCEIIGKNKVKFTAKKKYFKNFEVAASFLAIVPKHLYENPTKAQQKKLNKTIIGTGPYMLDKYKRGKNLTLKANPSWWGSKVSKKKGENNFKKIQMKFVKDDTKAIQAIEKGDLDYNSLNAEDYDKKAKGPKWGKDVFKVSVKNKSPVSYGFIGWNLKHELFKSRKVRLALYHLLDRKKMIKKFLNNRSLPATGPLFQQSLYANKKVKPVLFDRVKAIKLLASEGWTDSDKDGVLDKVVNGKKKDLSFTIFEPNKDFKKYLTLYQEDAKKAGVKIIIKVVEWNTFIKKLDERDFEAVRLGWGGGSVDWDPKQIWHSDSIANKGSNFISYSNPKVDKLIEKARGTLDRAKRVKVLRKVYKLIADDVPYAFFFNAKSSFYSHRKRMKRVRDTYAYGIGVGYWWIKK